MASRINTILIIGATTGIGEGLARRFHALGKKVIITGRRQDRLDALAAELKGVETRQFDIGDIAALPGHVSAILKDYPKLDTVYVNAGIQQCYNIFDNSSITNEKVAAEVAINLTAPNLLANLFAPHLLNLAKSGTKTTIFITTSSLAYIPFSFYPTYCATKAGLQAFCKIFRQQLAFAGEGAQNMNVVEIVPPYVDTGLDAAHRDYTIAAQGGKDKAFPPTPLKEFLDAVFAGIEDVGPDGSIKKEIAVGFGELGVGTWRGAFEKVYESIGMTI
ncbi:NAD(P)-binding protein [Hypomontagnella monticulosa]|nr:NAD(P)-binding protein [Hypomontagnella monticulosa]